MHGGLWFYFDQFKEVQQMPADKNGVPIASGTRIRCVLEGSFRGIRRPGPSDRPELIIDVDGLVPGETGDRIYLRPDQVEVIQEANLPTMPATLHTRPSDDPFLAAQRGEVAP